MKKLSFCKEFVEISEKYKDKIAACDTNNKITYGQIENMSNYLADILVGKFEKEKNKIVAILIDRSIYSLVCIVAIWKAGGIYLPIDRMYPEERINEMVLKSEASVCIIHNSAVLLNKIKTVFIEEIIEEYEDCTVYKEIDASYDRMNVYIIFTSGTTGKPKGAVINMQGLMNHLHNKIKLLDINCNTKILQSASQCFDISIWQFLVTMLTGGEIHILSNNEVRDTSYFINYIKRFSIDVIECVPSYFYQILSEKEEKLNDLDGLSYILLTGEKVSVSLCRKWYLLSKKAQIINAYGPTECSDDILPIT